MNFKTLTVFAVILLVTACNRAPVGRGAGEVEATLDGAIQFRVDTVVGGLAVPWSIAFAPDGRMLLTERPGRIRVVEDGKLREEPLARIPDVESSSEIGLMGLALHPDFGANHLLYISYGYSGDGLRVRVVRFRETGTALTDRKVIIENIPAAENHAGCRLRFGPDGKLYVTTGDATERDLAQQLDSLAGKILRLNDDGTVPTDNPLINQQGSRPEIWSYGHRNPQGLDWQSDSHAMFETEHGPSGFDGPGGGDEVNRIERGKNYGWPLIHHTQTHEGLESPILEFTPAVAPASGMFYRGKLFPELRGNFLFGCLRGTCLMRVVFDGSRVVKHERLLERKYGRIREVVEGPDGAIYFSTSNRDGRGSPAQQDDRILRLSPAK
jgi:aldose sugar dehydrogenase